MSAGRGRGNNMRQPHDNSRRELRRPMGGDEDLARGMGRMDPFGYGQYGGGGRYGMQNQYEPPRPAPNAEGWSSGDDYLAWNDQNQEDHYGGGGGHQNSNNFSRTPAQSRLQYNQQHYQQQRMQQQQWGQVHQQWNVSASEFVPKSSLSVSAEEFVPRTMARNTSQWAYQQQQTPQPDFSSQQQYGGGGGGGGYHHHQPQMNYQGGYNSRGGGRGGGGGGQNAQYDGSSSLYDPSEVLSDAIATVVFMPSKFERTTMHLAEKFNSSLEDASTMSRLVDSLIEQCLKEEQFHNLSGKFCSYLAQNVVVEAEGSTLKSFMLQKLEALVNQCEAMLQTNEKRVHAILALMVDLYLHLLSDPVKKWQVHDATLAECIHNLFTKFFSNASAPHVKIAAQKLKLCGRVLEGEERFASLKEDEIDEEKSWSETSAPKMDALITLMTTVSTNASLSEDLQKEVKALLDTRANDKWATAEADNAKAKEELAKAMSQPAPRKSAAIRIEPDPNDIRTQQVVTSSTTSTAKDSNELTEEELKFMSDAIGEDGGSDNEELEESDGGMTEDIADAYEQFLAEQSKNGGP